MEDFNLVKFNKDEEYGIQYMKDRYDLLIIETDISAMQKGSAGANFLRCIPEHIAEKVRNVYFSGFLDAIDDASKEAGNMAEENRQLLIMMAKNTKEVFQDSLDSSGNIFIPAEYAAQFIEQLEKIATNK